MTRAEIEAQVTRLAEEHEGAALVEAVRRLADALSEPERELLGEVLLERARDRDAEDYGELTERMRGARWHVILPRLERPDHPR